MKDLDIIPECYIDTNLIETILNTKGCYTEGVNHQKGCNTVVKTMNDPIFFVYPQLWIPLYYPVQKKRTSN